jgi:release factor glutamine methyltransferase
MKSAIDHLLKKEVADARLTVELLLSHALNLQRIQLYLNFDKPLTQDEVRHFRLLYERRLSGEPVQYIIGSTSFMGLHFKVDRRVFIPRPETESLLEQAIVFGQDHGNEKGLEVFEIGTGSGNIAISIAKFLKHARVTAIDVNASALEVARQNARLHSVESRIEFSQMDVFDLSGDVLQGQYDLVVSNPPYVAIDEWEQLQKEVRDFEPQSAVTDGDDGFLFHRRIIEIIPGILKVGGGVLLEVGFGQAERVARELEEAKVREVHITPDLQGIPRVVSGLWMGEQPNLICLN